MAEMIYHASAYTVPVSTAMTYGAHKIDQIYKLWAHTSALVLIANSILDDREFNFHQAYAIANEKYEIVKAIVFGYNWNVHKILEKFNDVKLASLILCTRYYESLLFADIDEILDSISNAIEEIEMTGHYESHIPDSIIDNAFKIATVYYNQLSELVIKGFTPVFSWLSRTLEDPIVNKIGKVEILEEPMAKYIFLLLGIATSDEELKIIDTIYKITFEHTNVINEVNSLVFELNYDYYKMCPVFSSDLIYLNAREIKHLSKFVEAKVYLNTNETNFYKAWKDILNHNILPISVLYNVRSIIDSIEPESPWLKMIKYLSEV